ncbi:hypothetical protein ACP275_10G105800 [Erythranthe tilingii]
MRSILNSEKPFGGMVIVLGGDFRQILPVVLKASRQDIVHATINSSPLWRECRVTRLHKNMRLQSDASSSNEDEIREFTEWILRIGTEKLETTMMLKLKKGVPVMLIRNIDQARGLCNGTRLQVERLGMHVISCKVLSGKNVGDMVFIPRMTLIPSNSTLPVKFQRRQYLMIISFAMTINKSQGKTLSRIGLYLPRPVFGHGQLHVALSRVKSRLGIKILIKGESGELFSVTSNVVYKEVFEKI